MIPPSRPRATRALVERLAKKAAKDLPAVYLVGVRGYYRDTMGKPGTNDRGIYDDAIFVVGPETFAAFNANTDPSAFRQGVASLVPGVHFYRPGRHGISRDRPGRIVSYPAFRPATPGEQLPVTRDGVVNPRPGIAINIHRGGRNTTSSEGCQTIPPAQWDAFYALAMKELKAAGQKTFPYILLDGPIV
jgi:lysozyme